MLKMAVLEEKICTTRINQLKKEDMWHSVECTIPRLPAGTGDGGNNLALQ